METIQITIDKKLLTELRRALKGRARSRSAFIRNAIRSELERKRIHELEQQTIRAYKDYPVRKGEFPEAVPLFDEWDDE